MSSNFIYLTLYNLAKTSSPFVALSKRLKYLRSGNLLITTMNLEQITKLKNATTFSEKQIPITSSIIWNEQFSYRKL